MIGYWASGVLLCHIWAKTSPSWPFVATITRFTWLGETLQGQVNIVALPLSRYDQMKNLEVLAVNDQRVTWGCRGLFLHTAHQTVKHLAPQGKKAGFILQARCAAWCRVHAGHRPRKGSRVTNSTVVCTALEALCNISPRHMCKQVTFDLADWFSGPAVAWAVAYPCFIAHSGLVVYEDGVSGSQVEGARPAPSRGDPVQQPDAVHLREEEHAASSSRTAGRTQQSQPG